MEMAQDRPKLLEKTIIFDLIQYDVLGIILAEIKVSGQNNS